MCVFIRYHKTPIRCNFIIFFIWHIFEACPIVYIYLSIYLYIYLSIFLSFFLSFFLSIYLSVYILFIYLYTLLVFKYQIFQLKNISTNIYIYMQKISFHPLPPCFGTSVLSKVPLLRWPLALALLVPASRGLRWDIVTFNSLAATMPWHQVLEV